MKFKIILLTLFMAFFMGCGGNDSGEVAQTTESSSNSLAPQPVVEDDSSRPPRPPSI